MRLSLFLGRIQVEQVELRFLCSLLVEALLSPGKYGKCRLKHLKSLRPFILKMAVQCAHRELTWLSSIYHFPLLPQAPRMQCMENIEPGFFLHVQKHWLRKYWNSGDCREYVVCVGTGQQQQFPSSLRPHPCIMYIRNLEFLGNLGFRCKRTVSNDFRAPISLVYERIIGPFDYQAELFSKTVSI